MNVRDYLGSALRQPPQAQESSVGELELVPHQSRAVAALVERVSTFGGALLADVVGLGKTRVCLATALRLQDIARVEGRRGPIWFVVPARIVPAWLERAERAGVRRDQMSVVTHTAMSRGHLPQDAPSVIVVDEAHRFRNPSTRRYDELSMLAATSPILLATATPVANGREDLLALLKLFLGDNDMRPWVGTDLTEAFREGGPVLMRLLERLVVRRTSWGEDDDKGRPSARLQLLPYDPDPAEAWVWANLGDALSQPIALLEGDWPQALFVEHVLRLWESGPRALAESLDRMVAFHERWLEAQRHGETIDRIGFRELFGSQPRQSVLPFMFAQAGMEHSAEPPRIGLERVEADLKRLRSVTSRVHAAAGDVAREKAILELMRQQPGKLLVFTSFRTAARSIFDALSTGLGCEARVGLVTGDGARATGLGRVDDHEVLRRFSPGAFGLTLPDHQALDVLVATDCIAEGVDLHDCGRIVLADLPYSPLRVEQRVGRLLRPGSPHDQVVVHLPRPRNWNDSLGMRRRLRSKLGDAAEAGTPYSTFGSAPATDPLAALTLRDGWLRTLPVGTERIDYAESVVVASAREDALWAIARLTDGSTSEDLVIRVDAHGNVTRNWHELMTHVDELTRDSPPVRAGAGRAELVSIARDEVSQYVARLNAARLAPFAISMDSSGNRAFSAIVDWAHRADFDLDVDHLRRVLLRPWPPGLERRIAGWITEPWRGARYYRDLPDHPATARLRVERLLTIDAHKG